MSHKHRVVVALSVVAAIVACAPPTSWARRVRTASKKVAARPKPASAAPKKYLQMRVSVGQVYSNPIAWMMFGSKEAKEAEEAAKPKNGSLTVDFRAPIVRLIADRYWVDKAQIYLFGNAAIVCEDGSRPLRLSGEQLDLSWIERPQPSDTVIEAQIDAGQINDTNEAGDKKGEVAPSARPRSFPVTPLPVGTKPLSLLLRMLQEEASTHGRFGRGLDQGDYLYSDGAPFAISRYVVKFKGASYGNDLGGYSENGQIVYDQRTRVLFLEARTRDSFQNRSTDMKLTFSDVTMSRLSELLRQGDGIISFTKPVLVEPLIKLGAKLQKQSLTSSTYK